MVKSNKEPDGNLFLKFEIEKKQNLAFMEECFHKLDPADRSLKVKFLLDYSKGAINLKESIVVNCEKLGERFSQLKENFRQQFKPAITQNSNTTFSINASKCPDEAVAWAKPLMSQPSVLLPPPQPNIQINNNETIILINKTTKPKKKKKKSTLDSTNNSTQLEDKGEKVKRSKSKKKQKLSKLKAIDETLQTNETYDVISSVNSAGGKLKTEVIFEQNVSSSKITLTTSMSNCQMNKHHHRPLEIIDETDDSTGSNSTLKEDDLKSVNKKPLTKSEKKPIKFEFRMPEPLACSSLMTANPRPSSIVSVSKSSTSSIASVPPKTPKPMATIGSKLATPGATGLLDVNNLQQSGKVKQLIEAAEARMKQKLGGNTPASEIKSSSRKLQYTQSLLKKPPVAGSTAQPQTSPNKIKLRSSIDKRKMRISSSKEVKRQSVKQVKNFLKDVVLSEKPITSTQSHSISSNTSKAFDEVDRAANNTKRQLFGSGDSNDHDLSVVVKKAAIKDLLAKNTNINQQYKLVKSTPFNNEKLGVKQFLDRNTPCKFVKTDLEEKRKQDLLATKEKKEQERLRELDMQKHEKIETAKKKREEKMKKIAEQKAKQKEEDEKRKEELDAKKAKDAEEAKKRLYEAKRKEDYEKAKIDRSKILGSNQNINNLNQPTAVHSSTSHTLTKPNQNQVSSFKPPPVPEPQLKQIISHQNNPLFGTKNENHPLHHSGVKSAAAVMEPPKKPMYENYDLRDLKSDDETDDEEEPAKPIPLWAQDYNILKTSKLQSHKLVNFTKLFKTSSQNEVKLEEIFKIKRKKFNERSSSAIWSSPPVWSTGLNGNESFRNLHNESVNK